MQLVAAVHHEVQLAGLRVPVQRHDVARAGDEALAVRERLAGLVGIEAPEAGMLLEQGARLLAGRARVRSSSWQAFEGAPTLT